MNALFKNTRLPLLMTLLCLHFLAVPVQGAQGLPRESQHPAEQEIRKRGSRADGQSRPVIETTKDAGDHDRQGRKNKEHSQRRKEKIDHQGQTRPKAPSAAQRAVNDRPGSLGRIPTSKDLGTVTPPADLLRLDPKPERARHDSSVQRRNKDRRADHVVQPRQKSSVHNSLVLNRDADRHDGRRDVRRPQVDYRKDYRTGGDSRRHSPQVRHDNGPRHRPAVVKHVIHKIPSRHAVVMHGRDRYHYYSGRFYRPWNSGFILVRPPLGLVVLNIPLGSRMVLSAGITYHVFGDVYYRRVPMGYQVVEPIRSHAANRPDRVEVIIDLLNVRYGPEASEEVIAQVDRYTTLRVLGSAPGWLYVEVEGDDLRGWVMDRYVSANSAQG
ncbi:DUF6515 family protein [Desulfomicrobium baculatum]|uniref:SH3 type 3 domain protein n=1 Tax=Desulfomicrobium baculatum (strain DSM 4028 / VKM B-1378 / X) TaxID=525897 RepID=C7LX77_DESBD|nr:DUF6515 family protein [Desulfomicrobium baculatum]ACU88750.1 SH3 type 3 domain protein [Desulfomicrobium baculatum DSM 4028]